VGHASLLRQFSQQPRLIGLIRLIGPIWLAAAGLRGFYRDVMMNRMLRQR
jgi:hypothetical protein